MGGLGVLAGRSSHCRSPVVLMVVLAMVSLVGTVSSAQAALGQATLSQSTPSSAEMPFPVAAALRSYLSTRSGRVSVAMFDARTGETYSYNGGAQFVTASVVKVAILETLLRRAQDARRSLTSRERSLARRMIVHSDNAATTTLWNEVGRASGVRAFMNKVGMPSTTPGDSWGLTSTNTPDQVRLVRTVTYPNAILSDASRGYARSLMRGVTPSQKWGISSGVPASATVGLKNGWLPRTGGWVINSVGYARGGPRDYVIAVLTSGNPSMSYGITTVEHVARMVAVVRPAVSLSGPSSVETGGAFRMSGYGYPARAGRVVVVQRFSRGSWREVGRAKQSSTGRYSVRTSVASVYKFRYRSVALAWRGARAVVSPSRVVSVHRPYLVLAPSTAIRAERVRASGKLPGVTARPVWVQRRSGTRWVTLVKARTTRTGSYATNFRAPGLGSYAVRSYAPRVTIARKVRAQYTTATRTLRVVAQSAAMSTPTALVQAKSATATVKFAPARTGRAVYLQVWKSNGWTTVASGKQSTAGAASLKLTAGASGSYSYRAWTAAAAGAPAFVGATRIVRVTAAIPGKVRNVGAVPVGKGRSNGMSGRVYRISLHSSFHVPARTGHGDLDLTAEPLEAPCSDTSTMLMRDFCVPS